MKSPSRLEFMARHRVGIAVATAFQGTDPIVAVLSAVDECFYSRNGHTTSDCLHSGKVLLENTISHVKLGQRMEISLNLAWALLAVILAYLWVRNAPREGASRWMQAAAVSTLLLILFPVISVTDDLQAAQNPADVENYLRRGHIASSQHSIFPVAAMPPAVSFAGLFFGYRRLAAPSRRPNPTVDDPAVASIQSRPPPTACPFASIV